MTADLQPIVGHLWICLMALLFVAGFSAAAQKSKQGSWQGKITDTHCGTNAHMDDPGECMKNTLSLHDALPILSDDAVYVLEPQDKVVEHAGHKVKVQGRKEGDTIKVSSVEMAEAQEATKPK